MAELCEELKSLSLCPSNIQRWPESYDTDLEPEDSEQDPPEDPQRDGYLQACRKAGVVPVSYFLRHMNDKHLELNHHGLGPRGAGALAKSLLCNGSITHLSLEDNAIGAEGLARLVEVLRGNRHIQELNLSNNSLSEVGSELICRMLLDNMSLLRIRLAYNGFDDRCARHFAEALSVNFRVTVLDLSHNEFCERGGETLGQMLAANEGLRELNLSWNHIRMEGAIALSAGLRVNGMLKGLDLSYNGFGNEGALALGEALRVNSSLLHLDINCNRIGNEGVRLLCRGLECNESLQVLQLARNPLTVEGAIILLSSITRRPENRIEELNISNVLVNPRFLSLLEVASVSRPGLRVLFAGQQGPMAQKRPARPDPMKVIQDFLDGRKLRLLDFFKNMDRDGSLRVPVGEFCRYVALSGVPLDSAQVDSLVQRLDKNQTGSIDYRDLADSRKKMVKDQRKQQRRKARKERLERQRSQRALQSFHNAVRALTPPPASREAAGSSHFSGSALSSWCQEIGGGASSPHTQGGASEAECFSSSQGSLGSPCPSEPPTSKRSPSPSLGDPEN